MSPNVTCIPSVDLSSPPQAKSSSFVTAALPSVSEFIAIEPPIGIATPFGNETPVAIEFPRQRPPGPFAIETPAAEPHRPRSPSTSKTIDFEAHRFRNSPRSTTLRKRRPSPGPLQRPPRSRRISGNVDLNLEIEILRA